MMTAMVAPFACCNNANTVSCFDAGPRAAPPEARFTTRAFAAPADLVLVLAFDEFPLSEALDFSGEVLADRLDTDLLGFVLRLAGAICFSLHERQHQVLPPPQTRRSGQAGETGGTERVPSNSAGKKFRSDGHTGAPLGREVQ
jgi:hypothetical protein